MLEVLPTYPDFRDITLDLAPALKPFLRSLSPSVSEFTFTNLFLFRRAHSYRACRLGGFLLVLGKGYDGRPYGFPPLGEGDSTEASLRLCDAMAAEGATPVIFPVPGDWVASRFPETSWRSSADRDQADYVYLRDELATLPGKKFHKKKNRLLKFLREEAASYVYAELGPDEVDGCRRLAAGWCEIRCSVDRPSTYQETAAADEALQHCRELGLRGGVILQGGAVVAYCLGEELNPETFVVHFEKAQAGREGLAQLINRDFCDHGLPGYQFVNREQDLGDDGLRQAKESYHPIYLVEKHRVTPR